MDTLLGAEIGGCSLTRLLGSGSIGAVYEGVHQASGRRMAIKILSPTATAMSHVVERFMREARLCYQLDHPNLIRVHTWGADDENRRYMVMDYVDGPTLLQLIRKHKRLEWPVACGIIADVAEAMAHVHALEIVHRDIKPGNILVSRDGRGVLADLGLARQLVDALDEVEGRRLTTEGAALGSPAYMAPEQITDTSSVGPAADVYGLAASLYHAIAGRPPLLGDSASETLMRVLRDPPPRLDDIASVPDAVADLVARCLSKGPEERAQDATGMAALLREALMAAGYAR